MHGWWRSRKGYVVSLQWLLVGVVAVWGSATGAWRIAPLLFWSLVLLSALGNLALMRLPPPAFYRPVNWMYMFVADTVFIGAAIYCMRGLDSRLYLPYFLIILTAALTRSLARGILVAAGVSSLYVFLVWRDVESLSLLDVDVLIRLPFFFIIAIFTGYLAQSARLQQEAVDASRSLADQVRSLQQVAAGIAHEVRNPLTAMTNSLQAVLHRLPEGGTERGLIRDALDQVARVTRIVQETLDLARPPALKPGWTDLHDLVRRALRDLGAAASALDVHLRLAPNAGALWGDAQLLEMVLGNVLRNAVEAMPAGGRLDIETVTSVVRGREQVAVRVTDAGGGIPAHQLARLFQPFYTTKPGGTGLGLCLARKIVQAHGGEMTVLSPVHPAGVGPAGGTMVRMVLPVAGPAPVAVGEVAAAGAGLP